MGLCLVSTGLLLPFVFLFSAHAFQVPGSAWIAAIECSSDPRNTSLIQIASSEYSVNEEPPSWKHVYTSSSAEPAETQDESTEGASQKDDSCKAQQLDPKTKKQKRGSIVAAPIPIASPAIGSGAVLAGGYISLRKSDTVSQPSTVGAAVLITDNGSRAWGSGGEFYFKQDTYHLTAIYFRGNINYDFYGTGTASGNAGHKLPLKQTGEMFLETSYTSSAGSSPPGLDF